MNEPRIKNNFEDGNYTNKNNMSKSWHPRKTGDLIRALACMIYFHTHF